MYVKKKGFQILIRYFTLSNMVDQKVQNCHRKYFDNIRFHKLLSNLRIPNTYKYLLIIHRPNLTQIPPLLTNFEYLASQLKFSGWWKESSICFWRCDLAEKAVKADQRSHSLVKNYKWPNPNITKQPKEKKCTLTNVSQQSTFSTQLVMCTTHVCRQPVTH